MTGRNKAMADQHDVLILGGGHNGLVAATLLAQAGRSVLVLERRAMLGGLAVTEEFATGFRASSTFASVETFDPAIITELALANHGLEILPPEGFYVPEIDGPGLFLPGGQRTLEAIAFRSSQDRQSFHEFDAWMRLMAKALYPVMASPLPPLEPDGLNSLFALAGPGWRLRKTLGAKRLAEFMRFVPMPMADVVDDYFTTEPLKAAVASGGLTASWLGPRSPGGALHLLSQRCGLGRGAIAYPHFARGGTGALSDALAKAAQAAGVKVRTEAEVVNIQVVRGKAQGVVLADGEEISARQVISTVDPKKTFLELIAPRHLEPDFLWSAGNIRCRGTVGLVHFALDHTPTFRQAPDDPAHLRGRIQIGAHVDDLEKAFDDTKYGRLPQRPWLDITIPSLTDPSLAPTGKHVLSAWVQYPPYDLRDDTWDNVREDLGSIVENLINEHAPNFAAAVETRQVLTPKDLEDRFGVTGGCLHHIEPALDQTFYMRPMPGWGRYKTPIEGLFLASSGTHGGGGLTGLPGRNAARMMLRAHRGGGKARS